MTKRRKKRPKKLHKEAPGRQQWLPGAPRERPGAAQEGPRQPQEPPGAPQERPKSRPRGEKKEQKGNQLSILLVGGLRQASGSHFRALLEAPGGHFGAIFDRFSSLFWPSSRGCVLLAFRCCSLRLASCSGWKARRERTRSDPLSPPAREAFQAEPQLKPLSGGAERAREA